MRNHLNGAVFLKNMTEEETFTSYQIASIPRDMDSLPLFCF